MTGGVKIASGTDKNGGDPGIYLCFFCVEKKRKKVGTAFAIYKGESTERGHHMEQKFAMVALDHGTQKTDLTFLSRSKRITRVFLSIRKRLWPGSKQRLRNWEWEKYM